METLAAPLPHPSSVIYISSRHGGGVRSDLVCNPTVGEQEAAGPSDAAAAFKKRLTLHDEHLPELQQTF